MEEKDINQNETIVEEKEATSSTNESITEENYNFSESSIENNESESNNTVLENPKKKSNLVNTIITSICCVLLAACLVVLILQYVVPKAQKDPVKDNPTSTSDSGFTPSVTYDPDYVFDYNQDLSKIIKLGEYKGITVNTSSKKLTDAELNEYLDEMLVSFKNKLEILDRSVVDEDIINVDIEVYGDDALIEKLCEENVLLIVSLSNDDFYSNGIIGHNPGETVEIDASSLISDKDYADLFKDLSKVTFKMKVNYIREYEDISDYDKLAQEKLGYDTFDEFKAKYFEKLLISYAYETDESLYNKLIDSIVENSEVVSYPQEYVTNMYNYYRAMYETYANQYGVTYEEFMTQYVKMTDNEMLAQIKKNCIADVAIYSIIKAENITISEEEYNEMLETYATKAGASAAALEAYYTKETLQEIFLQEKLYNWIIMQSVVIYSAE